MNLTDKHLHILDKAECLFAQQGFDGTTVRDIAQAAGVNLAMISYYFGSKEKLLEQLFMERMGGIKLRIEAVVNNPGIGPFQKLEILIDQYIERVFAKQDFYKVMYTEQMLNKNAEVLRSIKQYKLEFIELIEEVIGEGKKLNQFKPDIDTLLLLTSMTGSVIQLLINKGYYKEHLHFGEIENAEYDEVLKLKLRAHIKNIFKATLGYE